MEISTQATFLYGGNRGLPINTDPQLSFIIYFHFLLFCLFSIKYVFAISVLSLLEMTVFAICLGLVFRVVESAAVRDDSKADQSKGDHTCSSSFHHFNTSPCLSFIVTFDLSCFQRRPGRCSCPSRTPPTSSNVAVAALPETTLNTKVIKLTCLLRLEQGRIQTFTWWHPGWPIRFRGARPTPGHPLITPLDWSHWLFYNLLKERVLSQWQKTSTIIYIWCYLWLFCPKKYGISHAKLLDVDV